MKISFFFLVIGLHEILNLWVFVFLLSTVLTGNVFNRERGESQDKNREENIWNLWRIICSIAVAVAAGKGEGGRIKQI